MARGVAAFHAAREPMPVCDASITCRALEVVPAIAFSLRTRRYGLTCGTTRGPVGLGELGTTPSVDATEEACRCAGTGMVLRKTLPMHQARANITLDRPLRLPGRDDYILVLMHRKPYLAGT